MRVGDNRVKSSVVQRLVMEFENITLHDRESVDDFAMHVIGLIDKLGELGEEMEDSRVVKKMLRVVRKRYKQVAVSIEMHSDLNKMSVEELIGRLRVAEDADAEEAADGIEKGVQQLLLTGAVGGAAAPAAMEAIMTRTTATARARGQAGVRGAATEGGASTTASAATSPSIAPRRGTARRCWRTPTRSRHCFELGRVTMSSLGGDC